MIMVGSYGVCLDKRDRYIRIPVKIRVSTPCFPYSKFMKIFLAFAVVLWYYSKVLGTSGRSVAW